MAAKPRRRTPQVAAANTESPLTVLRLETDDGTPVYQQLVDQLRLLANTGELASGTRLPSTRHLAANLGINRNTVLKAYLVLAREGILAGRRGGGTVVIGPAAAQHERPGSAPRLTELVNRLLTAAEEMEVLPAELLAFVARQADARAGRSSLRVGFVECNPESLGYFVTRLHEELGVTVVPMLIREVSGDAAIENRGPLDCVVSTFFHLSEVRRLLRTAPVKVELFAIGVRPHLSVLEALERLPRRSSIGVVYYERPGDPFAAGRLARMADAVGQTGVRDLSVRSVLLRSAPTDADWAGLDGIVVRPENVAPIREALPESMPIIEFLNDLDAASVQFLGEVFDEFAQRRVFREPSQPGT